MNRLHPLLNQYDTVLLDMDGVITSEAIYWDAAALTVWEMLESHRYFGTEALDPKVTAEQIARIRAHVFCDDALIKTVKTRGVNNNWDLAWLVIGTARIENTRDFSAVFRKICDLPSTAEEMFAALSAELVQKVGMTEAEGAHWGGFWRAVQLCFQEWFLGSAQFPRYWNHPVLQPGKTGLSFREEPLVSKEPLLRLLRAMGSAKRLGVGTGRPRVEAETPLANWGILDAFSPDAFVTYQEVQAAQADLQSTHPGLTLTKPHPYMFLKGVFGSSCLDAALVAGEYDSAPCAKTLVIGDAACDLFAAKAAGCDFAAVLTGIDGENARSFFEQEAADYILHDILDLLVV